ncbi:hypothetical protein BD311DRAFT_755630 [Dichomitus squalens]|uniref:Uncharacterized protein n=1 Tax=Dichomitus squalens TaxID=114155 RepID=A0A4Q9MR46_9APHY|nr:hypothetical protein BD311DRAFT_755630 [Dichomitus squalens]
MKQTKASARKALSEMYWTALGYLYTLLCYTERRDSVQSGTPTPGPRPILHMINTTANRISVSVTNIKWYME